MVPPRLDARGLSKTFGHTKALDGVDLVIEPGEVHALIGQNGSGKSTVAKILTGYHAPDPGGAVSVDGPPLELPVKWAQAQAAGISIVYQDVGLLDDLTVAENICVGGYIHNSVTRKIDWQAQKHEAERVLQRIGVTVDPAAPVGVLTATQRAEVGIARALRTQTPGEGLIILDEATRSLPREELARFHGLLRGIVDEGTSVLMVTHNLDEVLGLSDRVTVLRDGRVVGAGLTTAELTEPDLARLMLGRAVETVERGAVDTSEREVVAVLTGLRAAGVSVDTIELAAGEVVGLTGLPGTGFERIPYLMTGAQTPESGELIIRNRRISLPNATVNECLTTGIALVPERRDRDGLAMEMSISDNIALPNLRAKGKPWFVSGKWQIKDALKAITNLEIRTPSTRTIIKELSGGNQQKVLFAKWLSITPEVLVLHEPTQAVDVGARQDILEAIRDAAARGVAILLVSMEPSDLAEACDRVLIYQPGGAIDERRTSDPDEILDAVYAASASAGGTDD